VSNLPVSLIMTVRNEAESLPGLLESILAGTMLPAEIVIVDGGSSDGTQNVARSYGDRLPIRVIERRGANISEGRNAAIEAAGYEIIAATDAGVRLEARWLEELVAPFLADGGRWTVDGGRRLADNNPPSTVHRPPSVDVVSGFFVADPRTLFERALGATVLPALEDIEPDKFLPSSRSVAFRKRAWAEVGGYPEWLDYCEDLVFDMALRDCGKVFAFAPGAVAHFRPRSTLKAFFVQYYRYARGDGKADLWRKRHGIRYATYTVGSVVAAWAWAHRDSAAGKLGLLMGLAAGAVYCRRPYARLMPMLRGLSPLSILHALALVPVIRVTGDIAKMMGYPVGVLWRLRRRNRKYPEF
jgi:glycosyltransferase involved in cell wall biosynthesis